MSQAARPQQVATLLAQLPPKKLQQYRKVLGVLRENHQTFLEFHRSVRTPLTAYSAATASATTSPGKQEHDLTRNRNNRIGPRTLGQTNALQSQDATGSRTLQASRLPRSGAIQGQKCQNTLPSSMSELTSASSDMQYGHQQHHQQQGQQRQDLLDHEQLGGCADGLQTNQDTCGDPDLLLEPWMLDEDGFEDDLFDLTPPNQRSTVQLPLHSEYVGNSKLQTPSVCPVAEPDALAMTSTSTVATTGNMVMADHSTKTCLRPSATAHLSNSDMSVSTNHSVAPCTPSSTQKRTPGEKTASSASSCLSDPTQRNLYKYASKSSTSGTGNLPSNSEHGWDIDSKGNTNSNKVTNTRNIRHPNASHSGQKGNGASSDIGVGRIVGRTGSSNGLFNSNKTTPTFSPVVARPDSSVIKNGRKAMAADGTAKKSTMHSTVDIASLSITQFEKIQQQILSAADVYLALSFSDGSTQLREAADRKRKRDQEGNSGQKAVRLTVAYPMVEDDQPVGNVTKTAQCTSLESPSTARSGIKFVCMPLEKRPSDSSHVFTWTRKLLEKLMVTDGHKVCFSAQELIIALVEVFNFPINSVSSWCVLDLKIACWMLDSDQPPERFGDSVKQLRRSGLTQQAKFTVGMSKKQALCEDLCLLGPAWHKARDLLLERKIWNLFVNVETKLIPILAGLETQGILVDIEQLTSFSNLLQEEIKLVEEMAYKAAGHSFMMNSVAQLRKVLYDELKLDQKCSKRLARTQAGHMKSTAEKVLQQLEEHHSLPGLILEYRHLTKVKSTYIDGLFPHVEKGIVRSCWIHDGTATGRLTSVNPNIQNIPKTEIQLKRSKPSVNDVCPVSVHPRDVFVSSPGWSFLSADFQSIELRLLAHLSNDTVLLKIFNDPESSDIFMRLTSEWLSIPADAVTQQDREKTKRLVYAVIYGVGSERLSEILGTTSEEAKDYMDAFLRKFPSLHQYTQRVVQQSRADGYCRSMFGRLRLIRDIRAPVAGSRLHAERQSGNFVIQGSAADLCKAAMVNLAHAIHHQPLLHARLLLQIHDELLLEVPDDELEQTQALVSQVLQDTRCLCKGFPVHLKVGLPVSLRHGKTWGQMKSIETTPPTTEPPSSQH